MAQQTSDVDVIARARHAAAVMLQSHARRRTAIEHFVKRKAANCCRGDHRHNRVTRSRDVEYITGSSRFISDYALSIY